ncbi:MAG: CDP-diacylglycerol--serine O-phosphatidyltransferase [Rhodobacteraceae bacterium]|nr:CDP-diacylglycerol--serine O-phosphatidyltransferase [Paracoccaceae bacterium]
MTEESGKPKFELPLVQLLPNLMTVAAICAGLTAIRFGMQENFELAVQLILAAIVLDGLDGRVARIMNSASDLGAELDSLADFLNFGVAPVFLLYIWALQDMRSAGWISVLVFAVCCVLRLARFNVGNKSEEDEADPRFFTGVPAPAGALLVLLPMVFSFAWFEVPQLNGGLVCLHIVLVGLLMISRIPTWSFKSVSVYRDNVKFLLVGFAFGVAAMMTYLWATLVVLDVAYLVSIIWSWRTAKTSLNKDN